MDGALQQKMKKLIKIWFDDEYIYGESQEGGVVKQSLLWYPNLLKASEDQRLNYKIGLTGIHWRELDEDISFESFYYDDAEPSVMQRFFLTHPEINVAGFAKSIGINASLLRNYINGFKKPSKEREEKILSGLHLLGKELSELEFV